MHALPLDQEKRAHYLLRHPEVELTDYPSYCLRERYMHTIISTGDVRLLPPSVSTNSADSASVKPFCSELFQGEVDPFQARDHSHHYFANLRVISSRCIAKITRLPSGQSVSLSHSSQSSVVSGASVSASEKGVSAVSLQVEMTYSSVITVRPWYLSHAEVTRVASPSTTKPIAPDGRCGHMPYVVYACSHCVCALKNIPEHLFP